MVWLLVDIDSTAKPERTNNVGTFYKTIVGKSRGVQVLKINANQQSEDQVLLKNYTANI